MVEIEEEYETHIWVSEAVLKREEGEQEAKDMIKVARSEELEGCGCILARTREGKGIRSSDDGPFLASWKRGF